MSHPYHGHCHCHLHNTHHPAECACLERVLKTKIVKLRYIQFQISLHCWRQILTKAYQHSNNDEAGTFPTGTNYQNQIANAHVKQSPKILVAYHESKPSVWNLRSIRSSGFSSSSSNSGMYVSGGTYPTMHLRNYERVKRHSSSAHIILLNNIQTIYHLSATYRTFLQVLEIVALIVIYLHKTFEVEQQMNTSCI